MRDRVDSLGVAEPELQRSGENQIDVSLPGVKNAERAADQVGTTAQMYFYDWEPNVLDEDCKTNPESVNGGQQPISGLYNAVKRASKCDAEIDDNNTTSGALLRVRQGVERAAQRRRPGGEPRRTSSEDLAAQNLTRAAEILEVPEGVDRRCATQTSASPTSSSGEVDNWWVIKDNPVLGGADIKNPEQNFEDGTGGPPIVTMEFTDKGREAFAETTRAIAQRGADNAALNGGLQDPISASHHFAIRLDNELISTPYINFRENPDGIDGEQGAQISGGFTITDRAGPRAAAQDRRAAARARADLALAGLGDARPAGARPGPDRGPRGFAIVALFLLVFYRVLGVIAVDRAGHLRALLLRADQADPGHADAAGHRRPDPHDRRRGGREHRHLRARQGGDTQRPIDRGRHRAGLQEGLRDDRRRQHRHAARRVHPVHPRDRGRQGLRVRARHRHDRLAVHGGARDAGDPAVAARLAAAAAAARRSARARSASRSRSTSWARRAGSSRCRA